jgi:hypothetical protein
VPIARRLQRHPPPLTVAVCPTLPLLSNLSILPALPCPQMAACHLGAPEAAEGGVSHPLMPFVLIQGPPGTGKTHTVKVCAPAGCRAWLAGQV